MSLPSDLQTRIAHRKQLLISEIHEHKKNSCRAGAADAVDRLKAQLAELALIVKQGVADDSTKRMLEQWISR